MRPWRSRGAHALTTSSLAAARRGANVAPHVHVPRIAGNANTVTHLPAAGRLARRFTTTVPAMSAISVTLHERNAASNNHHVGNPPKSFRNPWPSAGAGSHLINALKTRFGPGRNIVPIPTDGKQLVPVRTPDWGAGRPGLKATWFGHASFLVETSAASGAERGVRVLFDPVFSRRMSPVSFAGPVRFVELPCGLDDVPPAELVVISHNHYDHLDVDTVQRVYRARGRGNVHFLCPLGIGDWLRGVGVDAADVSELDWWQESTVEVRGLGSVALACTPSQHHGGRGLFDHDRALWCSWVLRDGNDTRLYFAGDTGYRSKTQEALAAGDDAVAALPHCPAFKEIGAKYGPFDLSLLPIGCYSPRHALSKVHCSPEDSIEVHKEVRSRKSIGMHYGTIRGGISQFFEPVTDPPRVWREACEKAGLKWGEEVGLCDLGETVVVQSARQEEGIDATKT